MIDEKTIGYVKELFLGHVDGVESPLLYATCGIPGAGKSTFVDQKLASGEFPRNAFILNPDRVMLAMPEYIKDANQFGAQKAYEKWEKPAWDLAYLMAEEALLNNCNIIKDMGCANPLSFDFVKRLKDKGYSMIMFYIHCDMNEAFKRIDQRAFQISKDSVAWRYESLQSLLPLYVEIAEEFHKLDNTNLDHPFQIAA
jgi:predicted ABC-type ATPase